MPRYQRVEWDHDFVDEPVLIYSEVADFGVETRKVEVFRDGGMQFADSTTSVGDTALSQEPLPSLEEINDDPEFSGRVIPRADFETVWRAALQM